MLFQASARHLLRGWGAHTCRRTHALCTYGCVSICTCVLVKHVLCTSNASDLRSFGSQCRQRQYLHLCTSKAHTFVQVKQVTCAASVLDAGKDSICTCVSVKHVLCTSNASDLRSFGSRCRQRQYLHLCTCKARTFVQVKQVTCAALALDAGKDSICTCVLVKHVLLYE
jgi:predicted thioesterase